jgi:hypothetical protein
MIGSLYGKNFLHCKNLMFARRVKVGCMHSDIDFTRLEVRCFTNYSEKIKYGRSSWLVKRMFAIYLFRRCLFILNGFGFKILSQFYPFESKNSLQM